MRPEMFFLFGKPIFLFSQCNALHKEAHVPCKHPHGLLALFVHLRLTLFSAVYAVPVLAGSNGHIGNGKELVQLVKGGGAAPRLAQTTLAPTFMLLSK